MMVRMSEAWPGQSTSVICMRSYGSCARCAGMSMMNDEKPRSSVMPRSLDCGCLSKAAVEPIVERARVSEVLPESTWPSTPTLMLSVREPPLFAPAALAEGPAGAVELAAAGFTAGAEVAASS